MKVSDYNYTLAEVAEELGVGRERVRQIEKIALEKFRIGMEARGITRTVLDEESTGPGLFDVKSVL